MPWHVGSSDKCPPSKPYAVIKDADGSVAGCHPTREKAEAQMAALYANAKAMVDALDKATPVVKTAWTSAYVTALPDSAFACVDSSGRHYPHHDASGKLDLPHLRNAMSRLGQADTTSCGASHLRAHAKTALGEKMEPIKAEQVGPLKWRVLAIPFGGPFKGGKDLDGEYFSPRTDVKAEWFKERPVLWHHAQDEDMEDESLGIEGELSKEKDGWWADMWLERSSRYWQNVSKLLAAGKVYGSSGALGHLVRKSHDGEILVWPHIEQTLTPTPANPFSRVIPGKAWDDFTTAGITLDDDMRPVFTEPDESDLDTDLPQGGDDPAMARLAATLDQLDEVLRHMRR